MKFAVLTTILLATGATYGGVGVDNGWYSSAFGGYTYLSSNINTHYYGFLLSNAHYFYGYNVGGSMGYQKNALRYEFQYTYLYAATDRYNVNQKKARDVDGGTKANVLMANFYYDFPEIFMSISPFLGVGIGYAFMDATLNSTSRFDRPHFNTDQNAFAYQGGGGLTYNFSKQFAMNAAYRYTATTNGEHWGRPLQAQMGSFGIVYRFDKGND